MKKLLLILAFTTLAIDTNANTISSEEMVECNVWVNYYDAQGNWTHTIIRPAQDGEDCNESINIRRRPNVPVIED